MKKSLLATIIFLTVVPLIVYFLVSKPHGICPNKELPKISKEELSHHDGGNSDPIYIAYNCDIYDVTEGKEQYYGVGKTYHYLAGRDSTKQLNIFGGGILKKKYPVVGVLSN